METEEEGKKTKDLKEAYHALIIIIIITIYLIHHNTFLGCSSSIHIK